VDADGYCTQCGAKAPLPRDHMVMVPAGWVAAVSDRGVRHRRNEDAAAVLADGGHAALVVCDGVSTSQDSDVASLAAAQAAAAALGTGSVGLAEGSARVAALGARVTRATAAAAAAVAAATHDVEAESPPSCTFVAAVVQGPLVVVGVVGDSRAYWLPDAGEPQLLTIDDSVAGQQIAAGKPRAEAEAGPQAHAITRWLGVDSPDESPRLTSLAVDGPGWLLLCSDGLWNYCSEPTAMRDVVASSLAQAGGAPLATASALVDWANAQGGHDNITVVLARLGAAREEGTDQA
jgi:serine/threonine protein phosphatase PrpC